jgi:hypothetical protein
VDREVPDALPTGFDPPAPAFADDKRVASADLNATLLAWRPGAGPEEHVNDERDVLVFVVDGSATVTIDGEEDELIGRLAPDGASLRIGESGAFELSGSEPLDQREQLPLLPSNVRSEQLADLADARPDVGDGFKLCDKGAKALVVEERLDKQRTRLFEIRDERKQHLFLLAKVRRSLRSEE